MKNHLYRMTIIILTACESALELKSLECKEKQWLSIEMMTKKKNKNKNDSD